jgi:hypothetical protein
VISFFISFASFLRFYQSSNSFLLYLIYDSFARPLVDKKASVSSSWSSCSITISLCSCTCLTASTTPNSYLISVRSLSLVLAELLDSFIQSYCCSIDFVTYFGRVVPLRRFASALVAALKLAWYGEPLSGTIFSLSSLKRIWMLTLHS